jgi:hypothetical protein
MMPEGRDADAFRQVVLERFDMSLGTGLGKLKGKVFRMATWGDLMLAGTLAASRWDSRWLAYAQGGRCPGGFGPAGERIARACTDRESGMRGRGSGSRTRAFDP